jgi:hypothetical protein
MGTYFGPDGKKVIGQKMSGGGHCEELWAVDVAAAVGRCERGARAKDEMQALFSHYPQLKENRWKPFEHPMSPLTEWFVKQTFE